MPRNDRFGISLENLKEKFVLLVTARAKIKDAILVFERLYLETEAVVHIPTYNELTFHFPGPASSGDNVEIFRSEQIPFLLDSITQFFRRYEYNLKWWTVEDDNEALDWTINPNTDPIVALLRWDLSFLIFRSYTVFWWLKNL